MATALISLGSNLGDRKRALDVAVEKLRDKPGINQVVVSSYHATTPIGGPAEQGEFLNAAARIETSLSPRQLLGELQRVERELGRVREEHWGPRTLDLDLLLYDNLVINEPDLIVPHRFLPFRRFVLEPAVEVGREMRHGPMLRTTEQLLEHLRSRPNAFSFAGLPSSTRTGLTGRVAQICDLKIIRWNACGSTERGWSCEAEWFAPDGKTRASSDVDYIEETYSAQWESEQHVSFPALKACPEIGDPKALFLLDGRLDPVLEDRLCRLIKDEVDRKVLHPNGLPTLLLPADDLERAVREAVAAIQAMQ